MAGTAVAVLQVTKRRPNIEIGHPRARRSQAKVLLSADGRHAHGGDPRCSRRHSAGARPLAAARQHLRQDQSVSHTVRTGHRCILALLLPRPSALRQPALLPVDKLSIVLVALFGVVFLGEQLTLPNWLGVILIVAGVVMIALP